jgi:hypothetical protein
VRGCSIVVGGRVEVRDGVGQDVEVVGGLRRGVGAEDGTATRGEIEAYGAPDAFCCAAGDVLGVVVRCTNKGKRDVLLRQSSRDVLKKQVAINIIEYSTLPRPMGLPGCPQCIITAQGAGYNLAKSYSITH